MRFLVVAFFAALSIGYAMADPAPVNNNGQFQGTMGAAPYLNSPLGYCQFTIAGTAALLTSKCTVPANARVFYAIPETAAIRWRDDGVAPTAAVGMPISAGGQLSYAGPTAAIAAWQVIAQSGTSTVNVVFYQ